MLVDTGPLYAMLDPRDERFEQAREDVHRLNSERLSLALSFPVLCESYSLVLYRLGTRRARAWLGEVRGQASLVNPSPGDYEAAADLISGYPDQGLSLFDAVTAALSEKLGLPVWTYDHRFDVMQINVWRG
ncbi:MAG: type II toxin-antitoxin system VapC family toxin [Rubrobacter sp.]